MSSARLRPVLAALSAVILASATVAPAIALAPGSGSGAVATAQTSASPAFLALTRSVVASASAGATIALPARTIASVPVKPKTAASTVVKPVMPSRVPPSITSRGTNHLWIPALGISRGISAFPCSRQQAPANYVYRWGCAGTNNVYLLGHASGVFKALHDAYYNGRLKVGLTAIYANAAGIVHTYRVAWWRVVKPTTAAKWAWASLASPGMTLQTCLGARSEYRLMVRLVQVH